MVLEVGIAGEGEVRAADRFDAGTVIDRLFQESRGRWVGKRRGLPTCQGQQHAR